MISKLVFHICGAAIAVGTLLLCWLSFWIDPAAVQHEVLLLISILFAMSFAYGVAAFGIATQRIHVRVREVLLWAFVFRAILLPSQPILETDWCRYLLDGFVFSNGINPYQYSPEEIANTALDKQFSSAELQELHVLRYRIDRLPQAPAIVADVNNADVHTVYPPMTQILFGISSTFFPFSLMAWRGIALFFDTVLILTLIVLLIRLQRAPTMIVFYAWSPLILKEFINTTHYDIITLSFLFLSVLMYLAGHHLKGAVAWAAAIQTKLFPLLIYPYWFQRRYWKASLLTLGIVVVLLFPFMTAGANGLSGLAAFSYRWESNSSAVSVVEWIYQSCGVPQWGDGSPLFSFAGVEFTFDAFLLAKTTCALLAIAFVCYRVFVRNGNDSVEDRLRNTFYTIGLLLLCSPVANPWYIAWMVPFLCFFPSISWFYLSVSCFLYYTFFIQEPSGYPPFIRELEYLPFVTLLLWESFQKIETRTANEAESIT